MTFSRKFSAGFFVRKLRNKGDAKSKEPDRLDATMIIQLKEMGFTLAEMNELVVQDYIDLVDAYVKAHEVPSQSPGAPGKKRRKATPQEFATFFGGLH